MKTTLRSGAERYKQPEDSRRVESHEHRLSRVEFGMPLATFRAVLNPDGPPQTFYDTPPGYGMANPDSVGWNAWENSDPRVFKEWIFGGLLYTVEYLLPGHYIVSWRIDWDGPDFWGGWMLTATGYDAQVYTKYHGPNNYTATETDWYYGEDGFTEHRYWNPDDNYTDPSVEIILGQGSGADQTIASNCTWCGGCELVIAYLGGSAAQAVIGPFA